MTKRELIDALEPYPDDAEIDVRYSEDHMDRSVDGVAGVMTSGGITWVTLGLT